MATLRIDDTRRVAPGQAPGQFAAPDASRGAQFAASQLQEAGQAITQAGTAGASIYIAEMQQLNESRVADALNRAQTTALELQSEYAPLVGEAAIAPGEDGRSMDQVFPERLDQAVGDIQREMGLTSVQAEAFRSRVSTTQQNFRNGVTRHVLTQRDAYLGEVATATQALGQNAIVGNPLDEQVTGPARGDIRTSVITDRRRLGKPTEGDELAVQEVIGKAYLDAIIATEDEDFEGAQQIFDRYRDFMTAPQQNAAQNTLSTGIAYNEGNAWMAAALQGVAPPPGQPGSEFQHPAPGATRVSSPFGMRVHPLTGERKMHGGTDFAAPEGSPARGMLGGRVLSVSYDDANGNIVRVDHGNGLIGSYAHLQGADVREGQEITAGQNIGRVGSTGDSTGPHLHVTMRRNGELVDPETLIGESAQRAEGQAAAGRPTRAQLEAAARERFGNNRVQREVVLAAISRHFSEEDRAKREAEQAALDDAYRHINENKTMPPPSVLSRIPPERLGGLRSYLETTNAPVTVQSDPATVIAIAAWTDEDRAKYAKKSPEELTAMFGQLLSPSALAPVLALSTRATDAQREAARDARVVPLENYNRALRSVMDISGVDTSPSGGTAAEDRRDLEQLDRAMRQWIVAKQVEAGRQLTETEIRDELQGRMARLAYRPSGGVLGFGRSSGGVATGYRNMPREAQDSARDRLRTYFFTPNPTEAQIYNEYLRVRVTQDQ